VIQPLRESDKVEDFTFIRDKREIVILEL